MENLIAELAKHLIAKNYMLAVAESCTGGLLAAHCTAMAGSSKWFDRGFVTYSNQAKVEMLSVPWAVLEQSGAVSAETATAMVQGALQHSHAQIAAAITGLAGPGGESKEKPVGLVWFGCMRLGQPARIEKQLFEGDREAVRQQAVEFALNGLLKLIHLPDISISSL